jgi:hypothetical protein
MKWMLKAWLWLKKYWQWLVFPVGIALFLVGRWTKKKPPEVVAPELVGAAEVKAQAEKEAQKKLEEAEAKKEKQLKAIEDAHAKTINKLTAAQLDQMAGLKKDPDKLNAFLLDVGKKIRG